jgi:hypothetical protein
MRQRGSAALCAAAWALACGGGGESRTPEASNEQAQASADRCDILTEADIQAVTGVTVVRVERGAVAGAGGTCANFMTTDSLAYLGVNRLESAGEYTASVNAVPSDVYPAQETVSGLGDEGVLFKGPGMSYLVVRKGNSGVVVFPMGQGAGMPDAQLRDLASKALGRLP